ncbi:MAG TPA: ATP-binding protein [Thermoanaerobaculia bacterium]|nr:ATP-binding protein [Thermoanaerobaculia bacterium]
MNARPRFYNPREASPEVLEAMLVGRQPIVEEILADLARQAGAETRQHWLIRGPRGIGKTHLIGIIYHRIKKDTQLERYLPVWLSESEAYSVYSAAVLLLQVAHQLVVELQRSGDPSASNLRLRMAELEHAGDDPALFEELAQLLRDEARSRGKILLVLMENLDAALTGLPGRRGTSQIQLLRSLLSEDKQLLFLSTTPTRYLAALLDPRQPLYGQLKERTLQPLTEEEVGQLLGRLAKITRQPTNADAEPDSHVRRRVLHRLTGGNPRAVVMAFSVLTGNPGVQAIVEEMSALLDAQTAYFEACLAQLAPRERAVVTAMALAPENLTLKEISQQSRLPLRALSTQVKRLQQQGYVAPIAGEGGKGTLYELSDGLLRLWYQFRKGTRILFPIVHFLALWHPLDKLEIACAELRSTEGENSLLQRELILLTVRQIDAAVEFARSEKGRRLRDELWHQRHRKVQARPILQRIPEVTIDNYEKLRLEAAGLEGHLNNIDTNLDHLLVPGVLGSMALQLERFEEAESFLGRTIAVLEGSPQLLSPDEATGLVASSMVLLGIAQKRQGRKLDALATFKRVAEKFRSNRDFDSQLVFSLRQILQILAHDPRRIDYSGVDTYSAELLKYARQQPKSLTDGSLHLALMLQAGSALRKGDVACFNLLIAEWAAGTAERNIYGARLRGLLQILTLMPDSLRPAVTLLAKSDDPTVAEQARLFGFVLNIVEAELAEQTRRARLARARVPSTLRQVVTELADEVLANLRSAMDAVEEETPAKGV